MLCWDECVFACVRIDLYTRAACAPEAEFIAGVDYNRVDKNDYMVQTYAISVLRIHIESTFDLRNQNRCGYSSVISA